VIPTAIAEAQPDYCGNHVATEEDMMASETIIVQIDQDQLVAQKNNQYSLYLAKKVNGVFTVIWQSMGPVATVNAPSYQYNNVFNIALPSYQVNYTNVPIVQGSVTFTSSGKPVVMNVGQTVSLDANGTFGTPANTGTAGALIVNNALAGNPHEILSDASGNPIFVNVNSGMDIGAATLTPIEEYQVWFDNYQETGTIIAHNVSNPGLITFAGTDSMTISYNKAGLWQSGPLASTDPALAAAIQSGDVAVTVLVAFKYALTVGAVTYLLKSFIDKFASNLRPTQITATAGSTSLSVTFAGANTSAAAAQNTPNFEAAVNSALVAAKNDSSSGLGGESWHFEQPKLTVNI
jgi:hypothetical protein